MVGFVVGKRTTLICAADTVATALRKRIAVLMLAIYAESGMGIHVERDPRKRRELEEGSIPLYRTADYYESVWVTRIEQDDLPLDN